MLWLIIALGWLVVGLWTAIFFHKRIPWHLKVLAVAFWPMALVLIGLLSPGEKKAS
ncbi:MAG: hypothetical protein HY455_01560 [Parcubacteria group bacterium]|nr:hypothetical protein [Parcubacteria group bacterium]